MNDSAVEHNGATGRYGSDGESAFEVAGSVRKWLELLVARAMLLGRPCHTAPRQPGHVNTKQRQH